MGTVILVILAVIAIYAFISLLPDVVRYLKIRNM